MVEQSGDLDTVRQSTEADVAIKEEDSRLSSGQLEIASTFNEEAKAVEVVHQTSSIGGTIYHFPPTLYCIDMQEPVDRGEKQKQERESVKLYEQFCLDAFVAEYDAANAWSFFSKKTAGEFDQLYKDKYLKQTGLDLHKNLYDVLDAFYVCETRLEVRYSVSTFWEEKLPIKDRKLDEIDVISDTIQSNLTNKEYIRAMKDCGSVSIMSCYVSQLLALQYIHDALQGEPDAFLIENPDRIEIYDRILKALEATLDQIEENAGSDLVTRGLKRLRKYADQGVDMRHVCDEAQNMEGLGSRRQILLMDVLWKRRSKQQKHQWFRSRQS